MVSALLGGQRETEGICVQLLSVKDLSGQREQNSGSQARAHLPLPLGAVSIFHHLVLKVHGLNSNTIPTLMVLEDKVL